MMETKEHQQVLDAIHILAVKLKPDEWNEIKSVLYNVTLRIEKERTEICNPASENKLSLITHGPSNIDYDEINKIYDQCKRENEERRKRHK